MRRNNISNVIGLENYYFKKILNITRSLKAVPIVWEELFDENVQLDRNVVVQVWKGGFNVTIPKVSILFFYDQPVSENWFRKIVGLKFNFEFKLFNIEIIFYKDPFSIF